ncbi:unnamed protein product, partial [Colletotrichum noveboracense]
VEEISRQSVLALGLGARNFHPSIRGFEHFPIQANKAAVTRMRKDMDDKDDDDKDDVDKDDGDDDDRSDGQDKTGIHVNRVRLGNLHAVGLQIEAGVIHCSQFWSNARHSPISENELMYLMTLGPPEALFDLMYDSLSKDIIDGLRHCGYNFPARNEPHKLLELIKRFLAPSISQRAIHVSNLVSSPFRIYQSKKDFASFAKLVKIAAVEDPTEPNEILALLLYRGMEVYDSALPGKEPDDDWVLSWDALIAILEN